MFIHKKKILLKFNKNYFLHINIVILENKKIYQKYYNL
jgi:hypothetical protein